MKNILKFSFVTLFAFIIVSCKNDRFDENEIIAVNAIKIDSVKIEMDTMYVFNIQPIKTYSNYTANCEGFYGYDYIHTNSYTREVASYKFKTSAFCGETKVGTSQINFRPQLTGTYKFKFWNGENSLGEDIWIEKEIVVE